MKKIFLSLILFLVGLTLTGCGNSNSIVGTWENYNDGVVNSNISYTFNKNNTGTYIYYGDKKEFTYEDRGTKVLINMGTEVEHDYSIDEDELTMKDSYGLNVIYKRKK